MKKNQVLLALIFLLLAARLDAVDLYVGSNTSGVTTSFTNGTNSYSNTYVGYTTNASNNTLNVANTNTLLSNSGSIFIGVSGSSNNLTIANGALVKNITGIIGNGSSSSNNSVLVTGTNSRWSNSSGLYVGLSGSSNTITISDGATVLSSNGYIGGNTTSSNNSVLVTGQSSRWSNSGNLSVGHSGSSNTITISDGATVLNSNGVIGNGPLSSNNTVLVTGTNSRWSNSGNLFVGGSASSNTAIISEGATVFSAAGYIGNGSSSSGNAVLVTGTNSRWSNSEDLVVGLNGSSNTVTISGGATVFSSNGNIGYSSFSSNNIVLVTGTNSRWSNSRDLTVGTEGSSSNTMIISNGATVFSATGYIGSNAASSNNAVLVTGSNTSWSNSGSLSVGHEGGGTLTVSDEGKVSATSIVIANKSGSTGALNFGTHGGTDSAGSVETPTISFGSGTAAINLNQTNSLTITSTITGTGTIHQRGSGTTILSGSNSYTGSTIITTGAAQANSTNAFGNSDITLNGGDCNLNTNATANSLTWNTNASRLGILAPGSSSLALNSLTIANTNATNYLQVGVLDYAQHLYMTDTTETNFSDSKMAVAGQSNVVMSSTNIDGIYRHYYQLVSNGATVITGSETISTAWTPSSVTFDPNSTLIIDTNGSMTVSGDYTSTNSGTLQYAFTSTNGPARIIVNGNATLGGTLTATFANGKPHYGEQYAYMTAGTVSGEFGTVYICDGPDAIPDPLLRGRMICVGDPQLYLLVAPKSYTQVAQNQNQYNVAAALNTFIPATGGDERTVSTTLDHLTDAEYPNAFNQISPALYTSLASAAFNSAVAQYNEMVQRLGNIRVGGAGFSSLGLDVLPIMDDSKNIKSSEKDILTSLAENNWGVFVDGNGIFANVNINNQLPSYSTESGGVTLGGSYKWNETFSSGIYVGYEGMQSKQSGGNFICDNGSRFGLFGTYQRGGLFGNAMVGGASHSYQVNRGISFPGLNRTANSAPTAGEFDSMLATGYDIKRGNFTFGPLTSLQYTYFGLQPFTETGAQSLDLTVANANANSMVYSLGSHVFYTWQANKNILVVPQINLGWQHEFLQNPYALNASFGNGANFNYMSTTPPRDSLYTGIGFTLNLSKKYDTSFFYNASACNPSMMSQNFFVSLGMNF